MRPRDFARVYEGVFLEDDGRPIPTGVLRKRLEEELSQGHEIIPSVGCDNFDWNTGCRGHEVKEGER